MKQKIVIILLFASIILVKASGQTIPTPPPTTTVTYVYNSAGGNVYMDGHFAYNRGGSANYNVKPDGSVDVYNPGSSTPIGKTTLQDDVLKNTASGSSGSSGSGGGGGEGMGSEEPDDGFDNWGLDPNDNNDPYTDPGYNDDMPPYEDIPPIQVIDPCGAYINPNLDLQSRINTFVRYLATTNGEFDLLPIPDNTPQDLVVDWINLVKFTISYDKRAKLNNLVNSTPSPVLGVDPTSEDMARVQSINNSFSKVTNMDYFPVNITTLPTINGNQWSAIDVLQYMRTHMNSFVDNSITSFEAYNHYSVDDRLLWASLNPEGAIVSLHIPGDDGSVITTFDNSTQSNWIFTTIHDPYNHDHPVSGNRQFGFTLNNDGSYTFFTKGVDRLTNLSGTLLQKITGIPFNNADALWTSLQNDLTNWINANNGVATIQTPVKNRPDWDLIKDVIDGKKPLCALQPK